MYIHDAHVHLMAEGNACGSLLSRLDDAGISAANIFSRPPLEARSPFGASFSERLSGVLTCTGQASDRLFPILWIHPFEKDAVQHAREAAEQGVFGFKIICDSFYVYEPQVISLLHAIARLDKPVLFHSGILWDGAVSSQYNRPVNWESLLSVPGLRFSLAHCSWPWYDECIALYGKFLNAYSVNPGCTAELFLDMTPGTPPIYRRDLIEKLFFTGYDISHNLLFGTDCTANDYHSGWAREWLDRDDALYEALGVTARQRELLYGKNALRFLGLTDTRVAHRSPAPDGI